MSEESLSEVLGASPFTRSAPDKPAMGEAAKPAEAAPPAAQAKAEPDKSETADSSRDEKGRFAKADDKPAEKPAETKPRADVAAIIDERRKRQALETEIAQLRASQTKPPAEKPSVFDNEDAAISSRMDEHSAPIREAIYKLSVKTARNIYKDFDEAAQAFSEASEKDNRLIAALRASDDPGEYIYTMGIHIREMADVGGDIVKYRDKVTASSQAQITELSTQLAAMKAENEALKKSQTELDSVPRSLNNATSGASPKAGDGDQESIASIARFGNKQR